MSALWYNFTNILTSIQLVDVIDILLVAYVVYQVIKLVKETRALQLVKGIAALLVLYLLAYQFNFQTMGFIMKNVLSTGVLALIVVFQPELRRILEHVAQSKLSNLNVFSSSQVESEQERMKTEQMISSVCRAAATLSKHKTGALMVFERKTRLGEIIRTGTTIDAAPSAELIGNIFFHNSPLHDGAMIVREGRLCAAGCFLPLSDNYQISKEMGTRHRAALGMSENSDAIIVVVSEETGTISVALQGKIERNYTTEQLEIKLQEALQKKEKEPKNEDEQQKEKKPAFWKVKR